MNAAKKVIYIYQSYIQNSLESKLSSLSCYILSCICQPKEPLPINFQNSSPSHKDLPVKSDHFPLTSYGTLSVPLFQKPVWISIFTCIHILTLSLIGGALFHQGGAISQTFSNVEWWDGSAVKVPARRPEFGLWNPQEKKKTTSESCPLIFTHTCKNMHAYTQ